MDFPGFGFSGYRCFGEPGVRIGLLKKINFIIGQNNSGKSNIIKFLTNIYPDFQAATGKKGINQGLVRKVDDATNMDMGSPYSISYPLKKSELESHLIQKSPRLRNTKDGRAIELLTTVFTSAHFLDGGAIWFRHDFDQSSKRVSLTAPVAEIKNLLCDNEWRYLQRVLGIGSIQGADDLIERIIDVFVYGGVGSPKVHVISAVREVRESDGNEDVFDGRGIIQRLHEIKNPSNHHHYDKSLELFENINKFVREVLEKPDASLNIPHDLSTIHVKMDSRTLPLEALGTGVAEVIILASAARILENTLVCIEEPEIHLHPTLQKKLIQYLNKETSNTYIIATHSAHMLDAVESSIFHVSMNGGLSEVSRIENDNDRRQICDDLGYRASDLLQTNFIIWVEGPSDRIYLKHWIGVLNKDLIEGVHYSIMFFGGSLVSHLQAAKTTVVAEQQVLDFVSLNRVNQSMAIFIDRDRSSICTELKPAAKRLVDECSSNGYICWVTDGRETENYLENASLKASILACHPSASEGSIKIAKWVNCLKYKNKGGETKTANKVKVANHYVQNDPQIPNKYDLLQRLSELSQSILKANGKKYCE